MFTNYGGGDGITTPKMQVDWSLVIDMEIAKKVKPAKEGRFTDALANILDLEKQTRAGGDAFSTGKVLEAVIQLCFDAKEWDTLCEQLVSLSKRRSQLKASVTKMVQKCMTLLESVTDRELELRIIETLRTITAGKIYVEVERARLTHKLAKMLEEEGKIAEAATMMQELQIETYGSMEKREKVELILEQMRLCLARKDCVRAQIISKKISTRVFDDKEYQDLKLKYYDLMIKLDEAESKYLSVCKHYRAILNTPAIQEDENLRNSNMRNVVIYLLLSPFDNEQSDLAHRIAAEKPLEAIPVYKELLQLFIRSELIHWGNLCVRYEQQLRSAPDATQVFKAELDGGNKRWKDLKDRAVEHNIRMMAKYYTRITLTRMAELLDLSVEESETFLSSLVVAKTVFAKVDRLEGIVSFTSNLNPPETLNAWAGNLASLMKLVSKTTHLINKEEMVYRHLLQAKE